MMSAETAKCGEAVRVLPLLRRLASAFREWNKAVAEELGLHPIAYDIVMYLADNPRSDTAKEIGQDRRLKANTISFHVDRLVNEGYLERKTSDDRRAVRLECTPKAQPIIDRGHRAQSEFLMRIRQGIEESELKKLNETLLSIEHNLCCMLGEQC